MPQGSRQNQKKCVTFLWGDGRESPEERPYDVFRGQNRYVTLPFCTEQLMNEKKVLGILVKQNLNRKIA